MRRLTFQTVLPLLLVAGVAFLPSCKRKQETQVKLTEETGSTLSSVVHVADPKTAPQLAKGFYDVERDSWRWTMSKFSVVLRAPAGAAQNGAKLVLKFAVPDAVLNKVKSTTLSAKVGSADLAPETYAKPGDQEYKRDVPASAFTGDSVTVDFSLDKFLAAGVADNRELAVVVSSIALESK
jgi:hypothetical protein